MQSNLNRRLAAESLEARQLMAGDVTARVEGGILRLTGDEAGNGVLLRQTGSGLEVVGTVAGGSTTTINGEASFTASDVTRGVGAVLGDGNDVVKFANTDGSAVAINGGIGIETGAGNDNVSGRIRNAGAVGIKTAAGNDRVALSGSQLGTLAINTDPALAGNGAGSDRVVLTSVRAAQGAAIRTGAGNDVVTIGGNSSFPLTLSITTDDGNDQISVVGTATNPIDVGAALTVNAGRGEDDVRLERVNVNGRATVTQLTGSANVELNYVRAVDGIFAYMGGDDDALTVSNSRARSAVLAGGLGNDSLSESNNAFDEVIRTGF